MQNREGGLDFPHLGQQRYSLIKLNGGMRTICGNT